MPDTKTHIWMVTAVALLLSSLAGCASLSGKEDGFVLPAQPPLSLETNVLKPGLAVLYFKHHFVRSLDQLPQGKEARERGFSGPPITYLNHNFGRANVFGSGANRGIALELSGYIRLEQPGTYAFQANSNDGFRMYIGDRLLIDDPDWHSDRLSPEAQFAVAEPGWYSLRMRYFQRKGTATLQLYWKPPGAEHFAIVPAKALAHQQTY